MKLDIKMLKQRISEKGLTLEMFADKIGIDASTLYRKLKNNGETFTVREVSNMMTVLELSTDEANHIFFEEKLA